MPDLSKLTLIIVVAALVGLLLALASHSSSQAPDAKLSSLPTCTSDRSDSAYKDQPLTDIYFSQDELKSIGVGCNSKSVTLLKSVNLSMLQVYLAPDAIQSIDAPEFEPSWTADSWLSDDDLVLTLTSGDIARAYPTAILNWHEIVNDQLGEVPVVITFSPPANAGMAFERPMINGKLATFGTSGRIYQSDLVMYDRVTGSFWSQMEGRPMVGSLVGQSEQLKQIPLGMSRWGDWKRAYPKTEVLARPTTAIALGGKPAIDPPHLARLVSRNYSINPYARYLSDRLDTFGTPFADTRLGAKTLITGVQSIDGQSRAYLKDSIEKIGSLNDQLGETPLVVVWNPETQDVSIFQRAVKDQVLQFLVRGGELVDTATNTEWSFDGKALDGPYAREGAQLQPVASSTAFWFVWLTFHPETDLYAE
ncbi:DUF3179 domain-containing protein [Candidatus Acetothermia bacterium]|nr:DUF3179 domain-containing protein [Candidatus Acetothermia bacterium]MBI3642986.1 DUF3179 domain-containing protein [Candidatus Acetothermia bacterium]